MSEGEELLLLAISVFCWCGCGGSSFRFLAGGSTELSAIAALDIGHDGTRFGNQPGPLMRIRFDAGAPRGDAKTISQTADDEQRPQSTAK